MRLPTAASLLVALAQLAAPAAGQLRLDRAAPGAVGLPEVAAALAVLETRDWAASDPRLEAIRRDPTLAPMQRDEALEHEMTSREMDALLAANASSLPEPEKEALLVDLLEHPNEFLAANSAGILVQRGAGARARAIAAACRKWSPKDQVHVLNPLRLQGSNGEWLEVARALLDSSLSASKSDPGGVWPHKIASQAVCVLVHSRESQDHSRVADAVLAHPKDPMMWIVAHRLPARPDVRALAASSLEQAATEPALAAAIDLYLGDGDPAATERILARVTAFLSEFACRSCDALYETARDPALYRRYGASLPLIAVLDELPDAVLEPRLAELMSFVWMDAGQAVALILAERFPERFVEQVRDRRLDARELDSVLVALGLRHPELADAAFALVPPAELERSRRLADLRCVQVLTAPADLKRLWKAPR